LNFPNPLNLYYSLNNSRYWLIRINNGGSLVTDSLMAEDGSPSSAIFAYHPVTNKIYIFHLNFEQHGKFSELDKNYGDRWIQPQVLVYDPDTFQLMERHTITDFIPGNYPLVENGPADVIGDYIVYYFFDDEWMGKFNPAMLFIFDTRTNEATWLRVGWR
jgi:hypothetical protein